jgi:hypothetical protein
MGITVICPSRHTPRRPHLIYPWTAKNVCGDTGLAARTKRRHKSLAALTRWTMQGGYVYLGIPAILVSTSAYPALATSRNVV